MPIETLHIDPRHPAFAGHFPGQPIAPGVLLLDLAQRAIEAEHGCLVTGLAMAKFLSVVTPGDLLAVEHERVDAAVRFTIRSGERVVASGRFAVKEAEPT
jgi:3-hydroxymyristoyl/3-hydroxydecanoyl-(acyl carrier protein) dehydratase